ncbi:hypothetical protein ACN4EG_20390 [Alkalinema pantanalense CENA528]|uniref:hypothetical protein n=1 Tax=Alkalinema pantanalense TaxID=1620705 RepID=UPI003D70215C
MGQEENPADLSLGGVGVELAEWAARRLDDHLRKVLAIGAIVRLNMSGNAYRST